MFRRRLLLAAIAATVAGLALPAESRASFTLKLDQTAGTPAAFGNPLTVTDGFAPDESLATSNKISLGSDAAFNYGAFAITLTAQAFPGTIESKLFTTTNTTIKNTGSTAATLVFTVTKDDFLIPSGTGNHFVINDLTLLSLDNTTGFSLSSESIFKDNPLGNTSATNVVSLSTFPDGASKTTTWDKTTASFTGVNIISLTLAKGATVSFQSTTSVTAVPAPGGLVLLGTVVPFFGLLRRRLRRTTETQVAA